MNYLWQQSVFFLLAVSLTIDAQNYRSENLQRRNGNEEMGSQAIFQKDYCQDVNVLPGQPVPQLIRNVFPVASTKGEYIKNMPVLSGNRRQLQQPAFSRKTAPGCGKANALYSVSPAKTNIERGGTWQSIYTPPSLIPEGVISPNVQAPEDFPAIQYVPFLIKLQQQSNNSNSMAVRIPENIQSTSFPQIFSQKQSSEILPGIYNTENINVRGNTEEYIKILASTYGKSFTAPDSTSLEENKIRKASDTICPRCGCNIPPVDGCSVNLVQPIIIVKKSKSKLRKFLPLILMALLKEECDGCSCCCNRESSAIPVPYPVPIPVNNTIIISKDSYRQLSEHEKQQSPLI